MNKKKNRQVIILLFCASVFTGSHPSGIAFVRLRKPLTYYQDVYGDPAWGLQKTYLLLDKQRHRGQKAAGLAVLKLDMPVGAEYMHRVRATQHALPYLFDAIKHDINNTQLLAKVSAQDLKIQFTFLGDAYIGHIQDNSTTDSSYQPFHHKNKIKTKNFALVGDFKITNIDDVFTQLINAGLNPTRESDITIVANLISYYLDREYLTTSISADTYQYIQGQQLAKTIAQEIDLVRVFNYAADDWDGGYVFAGLLGNGDVFVCRDPSGIRSGFLYLDDDVIAVASERAALMQVFNTTSEHIVSIKPGYILIIKSNGHIEEQQFIKQLPLRQCAHERICSSINDYDIYEEHKALGRNNAQQVLDALNYNLEHVIFDYIHGAESALIGMLEEIDQLIHTHHANILWEKIKHHDISPEDIDIFANCRPHFERICNGQLANMILTKGIIQPEDTFVLMVNSIEQSLAQNPSFLHYIIDLNPKRIIIVNAFPPTMYPDCYATNMYNLDELITFQAMLSLLAEQEKTEYIHETALACAAQINTDSAQAYSPIQALYEHLTLEQLVAKNAELLLPAGTTWQGGLDIIYQTIDGLHHAMPDHTGDWCFTGNYPTPGGYNILNKHYLNWYNRLR